MTSDRMITKGFVRGVPFDLLVVRIDGVWVGADVAAAFEAMRAAALADDVRLALTSGWRSHDEQRSLWRERQCACHTTTLTHDAQCPRRRLGPAARPGFSNHQSGRAIDIRTGLTSPAFMAGKRSKIFDWLDANAGTFGFRRTVASEPWHWELIPRERGRV